MRMHHTVSSSARGSMIRLAIAGVVAATSALGGMASAQDNAAPLWKLAFDAAGYGTNAPILSQDESDFVSTVRSPMSQEDRARMETIMQRTAAVRSQFEAAARVKRCDWNLDKRKGIALELPHLGKLREASRLLSAQVMMELDDGKTADALGTLTALGTAGMQSGQDDILISSLVGSAIGGLFTEGAQLAIESGALDEKSASSFLESLGPLKGSDPFGYADAVRGEWSTINASIRSMSSESELQKVLKDAGMSGAGGTLTLAEAQAEMTASRATYERAALLFHEKDPNKAMAELQRIEQQASSGKLGALSKILMPSLLKCYQRKLQSEQDLALLMARLQALADGKEKREEVMNGALFLARAGSGARGVPDDLQESVELLRVAPAALDARTTAQAKDILDRADRSVMTPLALAVACKRCDFSILRHPEPTLDIKLLGGIRGATRMALANGLLQARQQHDATAIVAPAVLAYRVAALLSTDPALSRALVAHSIWREANAAVAEAIKIGPLTKSSIEEIERAILVMPTGDPFAFRKATESDARRVVSERMPSRSTSMEEAKAARTQILKQRGTSSVLARVAWASIARKEPTANPSDAAMVRLTDIYPAATSAALLKSFDEFAVKAQARNLSEDVPFDLPLEEQKSQFRKFDPVRGVPFLDASTIMSNANADYILAFEQLKSGGVK